VNIQGGPEKMHKDYCIVILQLSAVESLSFYQNDQKFTGNMNNGQILSIILNILCLAADKGKHQNW